MTCKELLEIREQRYKFQSSSLPSNIVIMFDESLFHLHCYGVMVLIMLEIHFMSSYQAAALSASIWGNNFPVWKSFSGQFCNTNHAPIKCRHISSFSALFMTTATHIDAFFSQYPTFHYNPSASITTEFNRLCGFFKWSSSQRTVAREAFRHATALQFNEFFGTDVNDIQTWRNLCQILDIVPVPEELPACKKVFSFS